MAQKSKIEWTDASWNPATGCTPISDGCENCYAKTLVARFPQIHSSTEIAGGEFEDFSHIHLHETRLLQPLHWKKPRRIFVCSMSDLFHRNVPYGFITQVISVTAQCPQHTFIFLTKRPERIGEMWLDMPNQWLGVTAENQEQADNRIPQLLKKQAAKRFISIEPMLGRIDISLYLNAWHSTSYETPKIDWVIVGCESGPNRRPFNTGWALDIVEQCRRANVAVFVKQLNIDGKVVKDINKFPKELQIREYPQ